MTTQPSIDTAADWPELREAVPRLCARSPSDYWRQLDRARGDPEGFGRALAEAGYVGLLIPEE